MKNIPVVILCGGRGTRLAEQTTIRPKPLVEIGGKPILWHIMMNYSKYGFNEFILALGYKGLQIKGYFLNHHMLWNIHFVDTGQDTMTGGRLKQLNLQDTFMMTYGDGVSDVNLDMLLESHKSNKGLATLTVVHPWDRFGAVELYGSQVCRFKEKSVLREGWINGGFFVIEPEALDYIKGDVMWEHSPMEQLVKDGKLYAYQHEGFWQCMDTQRDVDYLNQLWGKGEAPWL